jgi:multidrug efflux pump subunit AcrB
MQMEILGKNQDVHRLEADIQQAIGRATKKLPKEAGRPLVQKAMAPPTALVSIRSSSYPIVLGLADELRAEIVKLSGVSRVELLGERKRQLIIKVDLDRLRAYGLNLTGLADRLSSAGLSSLADLKELVVESTDAGIEIHLSDLATLREELRESGLRIGTSTGKPAIALALTLARDHQGEAALAALSDRLLKFKERAPAETHIALFPLASTDASRMVVGRVGPGMPEPEKILSFLQDTLNKAPGHPGWLEVGGDTSEALLPLKSPASAVYLISSPSPEAARQVVGFLQETLNQVPGLIARFAILKDLQKSSNRMELTLSGPDHLHLLDLGNRISDDLKNRRELVGITLDAPVLEPELSMKANNARLAKLGLTASDLTRAFKLATQGQVLGSFRTGRYDTEVILKTDQVDMNNPTELARISIPTPDGAAVPLASLASLRRQLAPSSILRIDGQPAVRLEVDLARPVSQKYLDALAKEVRGKLPEGFTVVKTPGSPH